MAAPKRGASTTDPEVLLKRRKDRQRASEKLQVLLDEQGVKRCENENDLPFSSIPQVLLINQKNYYTEYLKKDDNYRILRNIKERAAKKLKAKEVEEKKAEDGGNAAAVKEQDGVGANVDDGNVKADEVEEEDSDDDEIDETGSKTIVIHPGSHNIKIGWADDVDPVIVPNLIGYVNRNFKKKERDEEGKFDVAGLDPVRELVSDSDGGKGDEDSYFKLKDDEKFVAKRKPIVDSYRERMKYYKRRILPNCHEACFNFNRKQQHENNNFETIGNDTNHENMFIKAKKWIEKMDRDFVIGDEVLRLNNEDEWIIRSPFLFTSIGDDQNKNSVELGFNEQDVNYSSREEILGDVELIFRHVMSTKFKIVKEKDFKRINVVLVIPSLYRKSYMESLFEVFFNRMKFKNASFIQEGLSASYGLGLSTGCIVDIGNNNIHICCVDDGSILEDSRISLDYGMSDVIRFWGKSLISQQFPYIKINFNKLKDWKLLENTFREHCSFDDSKAGVIQVGNFSVWESNKKVRKYQFKCSDENIICPMGLFYPEIFENDENAIDASDRQKNRICLTGLSPNKRLHEPLFEGKSSKYTGYPNDDPLSILQDLQRNGIKINELEIEDLFELLVDVGDLILNANSIGSGRRGNSDEFGNKLKSRYLSRACKRIRKKGGGAGGGNDAECDDDDNDDDDDDDDVDGDGGDEALDGDGQSGRRSAASGPPGKNGKRGRTGGRDSVRESNTGLMRKNMTPLDLAIVESITIGGLSDQNRLDRLYSNICLVGGGGSIEGFDRMLMDRLHINRSEVLGSEKFVEAVNLVRGWRREFEKEQKEKEKVREQQEKEKEKEKEGGGGGKPGAAGDAAAETGGAAGVVAAGDDTLVQETFSISKQQRKEIVAVLTSAPSAGAARDDELGSGLGSGIKMDVSTGETAASTTVSNVISWKGGCVFARLRAGAGEESRVRRRDWDYLNARALVYGSLFSY